MSDSDDDWGMGGEEAETKTEPATTKPKGKDKTSEVKQESKGNIPRNGKASSKLNQSNWFSNQPKHPGLELTIIANKQDQTFINPTVTNTSFLNQDIDPGNTKELQPDPNTSWFVDPDEKNKAAKEEEERGNKGTRGNRGKQLGDDEKGGSQRGNRGNRDIKEDPEESKRTWGYRGSDNGGGGDFRKKREYGNNDNNREGQSQYQRGRGGYRGRGRGGGSNNYNNNGGNNYNGGNNGRRYRQKGENDGQSSYSNYREGNNFGNGGGWGSYRNNDNYQRSNDNYRNNNDNYRNNNDNYRNNNDNYRNNNYRNNDYRNNQEPMRQERDNQPRQNYNQPPPERKEQHKAKQQILLSETSQLQPRGRRCWPETSLNILGCRVVVTARQLLDFRCKLLVLPYSTIQMEYYPGNVINSSTVDYRKKILSKGAELQQGGSIYLQKAVEVFTFAAIAFIRIDKDQMQESLKKGILQVLRYVEKIEKPITLQSVVFPICEELGDPSWVTGPFLSQLQLCRRVKEVYITTIDGSVYGRAAAAFNANLDKMFKSNEIFLTSS